MVSDSFQIDQFRSFGLLNILVLVISVQFVENNVWFVGKYDDLVCFGLFLFFSHTLFSFSFCSAFFFFFFWVIYYFVNEMK